MSKYHIRFATVDDTDGIMNFIRDHWRSDHILASNKSFFLYEYQDGQRLNFAIAIDQVNHQIVGLCGFIKNTQQLQGSDVWGSLWKVIKTDNPMLGLQILEFIPEHSGCRSFSSLGIAQKTLPIYDFLRYKTSKLNHYYRLNQLVDHKTAVVVDECILPLEVTPQYTLSRLHAMSDIDADIFEQKDQYPYKDAWYVEKRYFEHPIYQYQLYRIDAQDEAAILVMRQVEHHPEKILRIVDFLGNQNMLGHIGQALEHLMQNENCAYIDFYNYGVQPEIMQKAGFKLRDENDPNVIPNYFEPFVQANAELYFFNDRNSEYFSIFKADGDQDRPNLF